MVIAGLFLFISCSGDELFKQNEIEQTSENFKFDFSFFEANKGKLIDLSSFKFSNKSSLSRLETNNLILDEINDQLGTDLNFSNGFKELELSSYENIEDYIYANNIMNETDMKILTSFQLNLKNMDLSEAISALEEDANDVNLSSVKMKKFEYLANIVKLLENETPGFFTSTEQQKSCGGALLGLAFASAGLVIACNPPALGATVGTGCYFAAANFIRASVTVGVECS